MSECSAVLVAVGDRIDRFLSALPRDGLASPPRLLDVGCWDGAATERHARRIGAEASGIEIFDEPAAAAREKGVKVAKADLERDEFPWPSGHFDVVIANQVLEHIKNVWLPLSESWRVLRPGGWFIASVPNLASLHNRVLLGLGRQPTSIRTLGPHVRGYTFREIRSVVGLGGAFTIEQAVGVGFYPFPTRVSAPLSKAWAGASHTTIVVARRRDVASAPWRDRTVAVGSQTHWG